MAAAGVLSDFEFGFSTPPRAFDAEPSAAQCKPPPRRPDTPQLTLHDFRKFQHSPQLSSSPELDYKRVRRKTSIANLAASPRTAPFVWPTADAPSPFFHQFAPHEFLPAFLPPPPPLPQPPPPPPPATPQARPNASPSLSSTVTTLTSTPTRTPIFWSDTATEQRRGLERNALAEPLQSKRKFPSLKQAKRLPRRVDSGSGSGEGGPWEVYAAILEPPEQEVNDEQAAVEVDEQQLDSERLPESAENSEQAQHQSPSEENDRSLEAYEGPKPPATSSFSLSKFEFPVPPGHDNWGGHLAAPSSPQSPATFHLHGASFDLVNPHASLLLGAHQFETPAEIDGLLDDYFDHDRERDDEMSYARLPWSPSATSLGAASDSSRHTIRLYEDAASARRNILRVEEEMPPPPKVLLKNSHSGSKSQRIPSADVGIVSAPLPYRTGQSKPGASGFGSISAICDGEEVNPSRLEEGAAAQQKNPSSTTKSALSIAGASRLVRQISRRKDRVRASDPFDLTLSEDGDGLSAGIPITGHRVENGLSDQQEVDQIDSLAPESDSSQASSPEQETDPTLKDILNGYEYTRVEPISPLDDLPASSSFERGRGNLRKQILTNKDTPPEILSSPTAPLPTPPAPAYHGQLRVSSGCNELPTSDETYGETNQLLQITPEHEVCYTSSRPDSPSHSATCRAPVNFHIQETRASLDREYNDLIPYLKGIQNDSSPTQAPEVSQEQARGGYDAQDSGHSPSAHAVLDRNLVRVSSAYTNSDDGSAWETQITESQPALMPGARPFSVDSYANTSTDGTNRLSLGPEALQVPPPALTNLRVGEDHEQWARDHRVLLQVDDESQDTKKAISLLSDKFLSRQSGAEVGKHQNADQEQGMLNLLELERLRRRNPTAVVKASGQIAEKGLGYFSDLLKSPADGEGQNQAAPKSRNSFIKALQARGKDANPADPASDRRALLPASPTPGADNSLEYNGSLDTFVTVRDQEGASRAGKSWWPHGKDPTIHALKSSYPSPVAEDLSDNRRRAGLDIGGSGRSSKQRASRIFTGQSTPIQLKLLKPVNKSKDWHPLTDQQLADRMPNWRVEPNLRPEGALATYAMREEVRRAGPVYPRLPANRFFPEDKDFNPAYIAERDIISRTVLLQCCWFPPLTLAFALGRFDFVIERKTCGRIKKMAPKQKAGALKYHLPLGTLAWAIIIVLIVTFVAWFKAYGGDSAPMQ